MNRFRALWRVLTGRSLAYRLLAGLYPQTSITPLDGETILLVDCKTTDYPRYSHCCHGHELVGKNTAQFGLEPHHAQIQEEEV